MDAMFSYIIICGILHPVFANPSPIAFDDKKITNEINLQNFQLTLLSIEEKLRNLESFVIVQYGARFNGKIDYYGRKIDNIEKTLSKMEMQTKIELEKISEIIGSKNFKDDMGNDRIIRNIDIIHEKLNHKLTSIEQQADFSTMKMKNIGETLTAKLEKMEESFMIRDSDVEAELSDVVTAIDDLKTGCTGFEENLIKVVTQNTEKLLKNTENMLTKQYIEIENVLDATTKNVTKNVEDVQESIQKVLKQTENATKAMSVSKDELFDNLNEYANKIIDIQTDLWKKTEFMTSKVHQLSKTANLSRNEQQNSLRGLTVQLGRLSGKPQMQSDSYDQSKLDRLETKIDEKFQHILLTQNMFLESCHRVQMDEAQIESQIGVVLNKLIDIFENKTSVTAYDIERLEHSIHEHDFNTKQSVQNALNKIQELFKVVRDEHVKLMQNVNKQKESIGVANVLLQNIANSNEGKLAPGILEVIKDIEKQTSENSNLLSTQTNITKLLLKMNLQQNFNFSSFINDVAADLNVIKDNTKTWFLKKEQLTNLINNEPDTNKPNIADLISKIFTKIPDASILEKQHFKITRTEIENLIASLNSTGSNSKKIDNYTFSIENQDKLQIVNCLSHYIDLIDVRYNSDELLNCTVIETSNKDKAHNCLPNYLDIIDVRFNRDNFTNCINTTVVEVNSINNQINPDYSTNNAPKAANDVVQQVIEAWDEYPDITTPSEETGEITFLHYSHANP